MTVNPAAAQTSCHGYNWQQMQSYVCNVMIKSHLYSLPKILSSTGTVSSSSHRILFLFSDFSPLMTLKTEELTFAVLAIL